MTQITKEVKQPVSVPNLAINAVNGGVPTLPKKEEKTAKVEINQELLKMVLKRHSADNNTNDKINDKML